MCLHWSCLLNAETFDCKFCVFNTCGHESISIIRLVLCQTTSSSSAIFSLLSFSSSWWFSPPGVLCPGLVPLGWLAVLWLPWWCQVPEEQHTTDDSVFTLDSWFLCRLFHLLWGFGPDVSLTWFLFCLCKHTCCSSAVQIGLCVLCGYAHIYFRIHLLLYKVSGLWSAARCRLLRACEETFTSFLILSM